MASDGISDLSAGGDVSPLRAFAAAGDALRVRH